MLSTYPHEEGLTPVKGQSDCGYVGNAPDFLFFALAFFYPQVKNRSKMFFLIRKNSCLKALFLWFFCLSLGQHTNFEFDDVRK